jgi:hypothetical protein
VKGGDQANSVTLRLAADNPQVVQFDVGADGTPRSRLRAHRSRRSTSDDYQHRQLVKASELIATGVLRPRATVVLDGVPASHRQTRTPHLRGFFDAGGGTRTPDTRIMIAAIEVGFGLGKPRLAA